MKNLQYSSLSSAPQTPALSDPGYKVLRQLQKGCAYRVHGAWRFRGTHSPANNAALVNLVRKGLAEVVVKVGHTQICITPAGSLVKTTARGVNRASLS